MGSRRSRPLEVEEVPRASRYRCTSLSDTPDSCSSAPPTMDAGSAGGDRDHVTSLPAHGRNAMANLAPSGIQSEVTK
jgi:hypothetical protein